MPSTRTSRPTPTPGHLRRASARAGAIVATASLALGGALIAPATANAQESSDFLPAENRLVVMGVTPTNQCVGAVATAINTGGYPDSATVNWVFFVPGVGDCGLTVTLSWKNLDTNKTGEKVAHVSAPQLDYGIPNPVSHPYEAIIPTGSGRVEYMLTTNGGAKAGPITVETPEYTEDQ